MERSGPLVRRPFIRIWLWLTLVTSCAVFIEPAICDLLIVGLFGVAFAMGLRIPRGLSIAVLLAGIFLLGNLVASALTVDPAGSLAPVAIRTYLILAWWLLLTCLIYEDQEFAYRYLWSGFSIAAVIAAGLGALAFFGIIPDYGRLVTDGRVTSLFKDANVYGPFLVPPAIYALYRIENASPSTAILYFAIFCCLGIGLILGFSRGSWLNFAVALICYFAIRVRSQRSAGERRRLIFAGVTVLAAAVASLTVAVSTEPARNMLEIRAKIVQYYDVGNPEAGEKSRFGVQLESLQLAMTTPLGIGAGQSESDHYQGHAPHNLYLHVLVESGWIGGLAFLGFLAFTLWRTAFFLWQPSEIQGSYQVAYVCLLGILSQSFFVDSTHWRHLYLLLAMLWGPALVSRVRRTAIRAS